MLFRSEGTDATLGSFDVSLISRLLEVGIGRPALFLMLTYPIECVPKPDSTIDGATFSFIVSVPAVCASISATELKARIEINSNPTNK